MSGNYFVVMRIFFIIFVANKQINCNEPKKNPVHYARDLSLST